MSKLDFKLFLWPALIPFFILPVTARTQGVGAGPEDVYGGSAANHNYCTPYHFLAPGEVEDKLLQLKRPADIRVLDTDHFQYLTQGNNVSRSLSALRSTASPSSASGINGRTPIRRRK